MNCNDVEEVRDLYVLGALSAEEADGVEEHLATCRECSQRVAQSWEAAQLLRRVVRQRQPDASVRVGLLDAIAREQEEEADGKIKVLTALPRREFHFPWRSVRWAAAAAVVPLLVSGWLAAQVVALQGQVSTSERTLEQTRQTSQHAADVLGKAVEHSGKMAALVGTDEAPTATGTLYYMPEERDAVLIVSGMPKLKGEVYQLWLLSGGESMSGGTFYCDPDGSGMLVVKAPMPLTGVQGLRITSEPHGGNTAPVGKRYLWANMERPRPS